MDTTTLLVIVLVVLLLGGGGFFYRRGREAEGRFAAGVIRPYDVSTPSHGCRRPDARRAVGAWPSHIAALGCEGAPTATGLRRRIERSFVQLDTNAQCSPATNGSPPRQRRVHGLPCLHALKRGASNLHHRDGGNWNPRQVKGEHISAVRQVARRDPATVRFDATSAEGEAQAQTGPIGTALFERAE